jgi:hypothetical protein
MVCVEISVDGDDVRVGVIPDKVKGELADYGEEYLTQVRSLDEAVAKAKELLSQAGAQGEAQAQENAGFEAGFKQQGPQSIMDLGNR